MEWELTYITKEISMREKMKLYSLKEENTDNVSEDQQLI
jgi:hypothetical protein